MEIIKYSVLPNGAKELREEVFVKEQGFKEEFDTDDKKATHIVGYIDEKAVATCRFLFLEDEGYYLLGRVAVKKDMRKLNLGKEILDFAEKEIALLGGKKIVIHSQERALGFYKKCGYTAEGEPFLEEGYPHITVVKKI